MSPWAGAGHLPDARPFTGMDNLPRLAAVVVVSVADFAPLRAGRGALGRAAVRRCVPAGVRSYVMISPFPSVIIQVYGPPKWWVFTAPNTVCVAPGSSRTSSSCLATRSADRPSAWPGAKSFSQVKAVSCALPAAAAGVSFAAGFCRCAGRYRLRRAQYAGGVGQGRTRWLAAASRAPRHSTPAIAAKTVA